MSNSASHRLIAAMHAALVSSQSALAADIALDRGDAFSPDEFPALHLKSGDVDIETIGTAPSFLTQVRTPVELDAWSAESFAAADALLVAAHAVVFASAGVKALADIKITLITPDQSSGETTVHVRRARYEFTHFGTLADLSQ